MGKAIAAVILLPVLGGGGYFAYQSYATPDTIVDSRATAKVRRGPMVISVTESGEIEADRKKVIANEVHREVVIKWLVEEGTRVKQGDKIIEFECQSLLDQIESVRNDVTANKNYYEEASKSRILKVKELGHELQKAKDALVDAKSALKRYVEGEAPLSIREAESQVALVERDLLLAKEKLDFKLRVNADPALNSPYSQNEIKADQLGMARLELSLEKAKSDLKMLKEYDHPRLVRQLQADVEQAKLNLERAEVTSETQMLITQTNVDTKKQNLVRSEQKLKELLEQKEKLIITAEANGLVAYDTGRGWRADQVTVAVGESIRPRQQLMIIPDMTSLQIRTRVYEAVIGLVEKGQPAVIRMDARPEDAMPGSVKKVDVLPSSQHRWLNPGVKIFDVVVTFDRPEDLKNLKPGLTAQVQIELQRLENVLSVPIAAVFTQQEETYCSVVRDGQVQRVPVVVGMMNETHVQIREGLKEGEDVLLVSPIDTGQAANKDEDEPSDEPLPTGGDGGD